MKAKVAQSRPTLCDPRDYTVHGNSPGQNTGVVAFPFSRGSEPPGKPIKRGLLTRALTRAPESGRKS